MPHQQTGEPPARLSQRVQSGHQPGGQRLGRLHLASRIGVAQLQRRIVIEGVVETVPSLPVLVGLADQRPEQGLRRCPVAVVRVQRGRDETRCQAPSPEQRALALPRHLPGGVRLFAAAQLVQTAPDRIVFRHDHAFLSGKP